MLIQEVINDIEAAGIATFGVDMFGSLYPADAPTKCILIRESSGPQPEKELPIRYYMIQVLSRALYYPVANEKSWEVYKRYHGERGAGGQWAGPHNYYLGDYYVQVSEALQIPSDMSPDERGRSEVSFNILFTVRI